MLFIFMERHLYWTVGPGPFFYIYITFYCKHCLLSASIIYFTANKHLFPHNTFNPLLSAIQWDWQPHCKLGKSILVVLCAGSKPCTRLFLAPLPKSASNNLRKWFLFPTSSIKPWYHNWGKTYYCAHHTFLLGFPNWSFETLSLFLAPLPGRKRISARGVSHFQSFLLCYCFAYFLYFIFVWIFLFYQKYKKKFLL
jgi:hypothetical protein